MNHVSREKRVGEIVGAHLRSERRRRKLTLMAVESLSGGRFKANVLSCYERGERAMSLGRVAELAELYGSDVSALLSSAYAEAGYSCVRSVGASVAHEAEVLADQASALARRAAELALTASGHEVHLDLAGDEVDLRAVPADASIATHMQRLPEADQARPIAPHQRRVSTPADSSTEG